VISGPRQTLIAAIVGGCALTSACGSGSTHATTSSASSAGALSAEAQSAATGDIPDNQVFLTFRSAAARYSIKYPEGWTQRGAAGDVTFQDKNNVVHIVVGAGKVPSVASVGDELKALEGSNPTLRFRTPTALRIGSQPAVKATYTTLSAPNPVTGKRVTLITDRYELAAGGRRAVVDLGTAKGVDNVDAYRLMIQSFRWR
jgi:hypothetical protein